ncbi:MAG TPA: DUF1622 domain-containing protein [Humisphaera sp.]
MEQTETVVNAGVQWLRLGAELIGAAAVAIGVVLAAILFARALASRSGANGFTGVRLTLARYLALGLEFQLASDILSTAVAPTWDRIGKLGAVAIIRTALNFFLSREMKEEQRTVDGSGLPGERNADGPAVR